MAGSAGRRRRALALVPVINALTTQRHLAASLPAGDWVMAGFDLTCLAGALLLAWMARKAARALQGAGRPSVARPAPSPIFPSRLRIEEQP